MYTFSYLYSSPVTFPILLCLCSINLQNRAWLVISPQRLFLLIRLQNRSTWMFYCKCLMCFPHQPTAQSCWGCLKWQWNQWGVCCTFFVFTSWFCCFRRGKIEGNNCSPIENCKVTFVATCCRTAPVTAEPLVTCVLNVKNLPSYKC